MGIRGAPSRALSQPGHFWLQEAEPHSDFLRGRGVYRKDKLAQRPRCQELRPRQSPPLPAHHPHPLSPGLPLPRAVQFLSYNRLPRTLLPPQTHHFSHPVHHPSLQMLQLISSQERNSIGPNQPSKLGYASPGSACGDREVSGRRRYVS